MNENNDIEPQYIECSSQRLVKVCKVSGSCTGYGGYGKFYNYYDARIGTLCTSKRVGCVTSSSDAIVFCERYE
ncbi:hypothetical protein [Cytobacillus kochii]|uniref:hypothetical protein n=1 Tax=Cytobacillus kochii TaxID=859143 RepID=UPI00203BAA66|nr:hypothetical protein [Cytobacillus kochii]MCM3324749.1 hypothetical protein [Cytobacillus kochii]MCM3347142.1 hypothetical protein [Cytobacillus kochii]